MPLDKKQAAKHTTMQHETRARATTGKGAHPLQKTERELTASADSDHGTTEGQMQVPSRTSSSELSLLPFPRKTRGPYQSLANNESSAIGSELDEFGAPEGPVRPETPFEKAGRFAP